MRRGLKHLIGVAVFALSVTCFACGKKQAPKMESLTLICQQYKNPLVVGDRFLDYTVVQVNANMSNGTKKSIQLAEVQFLMKKGGATYNFYNQIPEEGNYSLLAMYNGMASNIYNFHVNSDHVYATGVSVSDLPTRMPYNRTQLITLNVFTADNRKYTEDVTLFYSSNSNVAQIENAGDKFTYRIRTYHPGTCSFGFSVLKNKYGEDINVFYDLEVTEIYATNLTIKGPSFVEIGSTIMLEVEMDPIDCSVGVEIENYGDDVVDITKTGDRTFELTGTAAGVADIRFYALTSPYTNMTVQRYVTVGDLQKTELSNQQTYHDLNVVRNYYTATPASGDVKLLVIPIWFTDSSSFIAEDKKDTVISDIDNAVFGTEASTGWQSVASFYHEESNGTLNITGTVADWYCPKIDDEYVDSTYYKNDNGQTKTLVYNAVNYFFDNHPSESRRDYDYDHDGYLDGVILFYAVPDYQRFGDGTKNNFWAYKTFIAKTAYKDVDTPGPNNFIWISYDFLYGSNIVLDHTGYNYCHGNTTYVSIDSSTITHEMGHMFGLPDYYDYSSNQCHAGYFSMQDHDIGGHDPFSMMALGWADPYIPTQSCTITINDFQSSGDLILLTPEWNIDNSPFDEYLLLELYTPTGLNYLDAARKRLGPNIPGIRLWHVNAKLWKNSGNNFTTNVYDAGVTSTAFNNTTHTKAQNDNGRDCEAYYYSHNDDYQKYSILHLVRRDTNKTYIATQRLATNGQDLFVDGDIFDFNQYRMQFKRPYYDNVNKLDFGQDLGWSFVVDHVEDYQTGQYSATITLTRSA